ncbi:two-component system sensor histidine kinase NtrB [Fundidesulfovibrio butyratiphilus]
MTEHPSRCAEQGLLVRVLDLLPDGYILLDREGRVVEANRVALDQASARREDWIGKPCCDVLADLENVCELPLCAPSPCPQPKGKDASAESAPAESAVETPLGKVQTLVDGSGRMRYFRVDVYPVCDDQGGITHTLVARHDVTLRTAMERRLEQAEKLAAIGELSTYISHEIRNPLFAIAGFANSLLRSSNLGDRDREKVGIILAESNRLDKVLKTLFDFTRPTQGEQGEVDVPALARQTLDIMNLGFENKGVSVSLEAAPDLPLGRADPELVKQCLINLLKNSLEAMSSGGRVTVRCLRRRDMVALEVEDTGTGIAPDILGQVFNPFFSTKDKGAGLGLAMTKKILDDLGGEVELESIPGKGTVVRLILPPVEGETAPAAKAPPRHDAIWRAGNDSEKENA